MSRRAAVLGLFLAALPCFRPLLAQDSLPVGYGTLRRDDIAVRITTDQVDIQVLPLRESVIRLLAPDTYRSLSNLIATRRLVIDSLAQQAGAGRPLLALVTFSGLAPHARFSPEDLNLVSRGRLYRPAGIAPISARWNSYQLEPRDQVVAIYLFEEGIGLGEDLSVTYQGLSSDAWSRAVRTLEQERARVLARAAAVPPGPPGPPRR